MYVKHTLKYCFRAPLRFILFVLLIALSTFLLIIQFSIYRKGSTELERTRQIYKVIGDISLLEDTVDDPNSIFSYRLTDNNVKPLANSPYIKTLDLRFNLYGKIHDTQRVSGGFTDDFDSIYFKGHVLSHTSINDLRGTYWRLEVSVDELLYAKKTPSQVIQLEIRKDDETFNYDALFSGGTYLFNKIEIDNSKSNTYHPLSPPKDYIISEEEAKLLPNDNLHRLENLNAMQDVFTLTYTNDLFSIPDFFHGLATITLGTSFSQNDYEQGNKVCIISQELSVQEGIEIGDNIDISIAEKYADIGFRNTGIYSENFYMVNYEPKEAYTIIGFYKTKNINKDDVQYFSNNTIFVPRNSCPIRLSPENSPQSYLADSPYYIHTTSFVLSSPDKKYELLDSLKGTTFDFDKISVNVYDQGYELIRMILKNMVDSSISMILISSITIVLVLALLVYLYLIKQKREYAIMRVIGETKHKASLIFYLGILFIGILGTLLGAFAAGKISEEQVKKAYEVGQESTLMEGIEGGDYYDAYVFDSEIPISYILQPIFGIYIVLLLFCLVGYLQISKKSLLKSISMGVDV